MAWAWARPLRPETVLRSAEDPAAAGGDKEVVQRRPSLQLGQAQLGRRLVAALDTGCKQPSTSARSTSASSFGGHRRGSGKEIRRLGEGDKIYDIYAWKEVLQEEGNGGKVVVCRPKAPSSDQQLSYVMKIRSKDDLRNQGLDQQFRKVQMRVLNLPAHMGIMPVHEVLEDEKFYYVVMAQASGGSLFSSLLREYEDGCMPAAAVRGLMREILEAVAHLHRHGLLHRDLKPDNIVMHAPSNGGPDKATLIDFDHADPDWDPRRIATPSDTVFGTLRFSAPEALQGVSSAQSDLYSVGAILYLLMTGRFPHGEQVYDGLAGESENCWAQAENRSIIANRLRQVPVDFSAAAWSEQPACRDLCQRLLAADPAGRPACADEALRHEWLAAVADAA